LIEMLCVMAVISIILAGIAPVFSTARGNARHARWANFRESVRADTRCVLYYTFEENTVLRNESTTKVRNLAWAQQDVWTSPQSLDGTVVGGCWSRAGGRFPGKGCLNFAGVTTQSVKVPLLRTWWTDRLSKITVSMWVRPAGGANDAAPFGSAGEKTAFWHPRLYVAVHDGNWCLGVNHAGLWDTGLPVLFDKWQHIALVLDDGEAFFYRDGRAAPNCPLVQGAFRVHFGPYLGVVRKHDSWHYPFIGDVDEVAVYAAALEPKEIRRHARHAP
jgi:hypothetical protein